MSDTTIIEINGVKMEADIRSAKRIDILKVGTRVKVLKKEYSDKFKVCHGIVIGFEPFKRLPTITIAYMMTEYADANLEFLYYNKDTSSDFEIVVALDKDNEVLDRNRMVELMDSKINKLKDETFDLEQKKKFFLDKFKTYWTPLEERIS